MYNIIDDIFLKSFLIKLITWEANLQEILRHVFGERFIF